MGFLHWFGEKADIPETDKVSFENRVVLGPQYLECLQVLVGYLPALIKRRRTERFEFLAHPSRPDTECHAPM